MDKWEKAKKPIILIINELNQCEDSEEEAKVWAHRLDLGLQAADAEITRLKEELAECKDKRLAECPMCSEKFFVDEDGSIDAFIGP